MRRKLTTVALALVTAYSPQSGERDDRTPPADDTAAPPPADIDWSGYTARGNEPFWSLEIDGGTLSFDHFDRADADAPLPEPERTAEGYRFAAEADGQPFTVEIAESVCYDSMSARPFPHEVTVTVHGETYTGCGGETASLLTGEPWRVTRVLGVPLPEGFEQTLHFGAQGSLSGNAGCNGYSASYEIAGDGGLSIGAATATERACAIADRNRLERRLLDLLAEVDRFGFTDDGDLELYRRDEPVLIAER